MVTKGNRLVDVGCDHGYLPVSLILEHKIPSAIAADVRKGPLSRAQEHIAAYGLSEYIETRLSDGLEKISNKEGDTLVIAGMGGPLMERILTNGVPVIPGFQEMILQPQSDIPRFRIFLRGCGWEIIEEEMVFEDGKYYFLMKADPHASKDLPQWTQEDYAYGKLLLERRHPLLRQFLERELRIRTEILAQISDAKEERTRKRKAEVEAEMQQILHVWEVW